jgi:RecB family exonuclease
LKYKYRYVLGLVGAPSHVLAFGQTIHRALRDFHRGELGGRKGSIGNLLTLYERHFLGEGYLNAAHRRERYRQGQKLLRVYYRQHRRLLGLPVFLEKKFRLRLGRITLLGSLDRVDRDKFGRYEIIDYKTGEEKEQKEVDRNEQLAIYALGAKEDLKIEPDKMSLYFLVGNKKVSTRPRWEKLAQKKEQLLEKVRAMRESRFPAKVSPLCHSCEFRRLCPAYKSTVGR